MLGVQALGPASPRRVAEAEPPQVAPIAAESQREAESDAWVTLVAVPGVGPITFGALLAAFGSARAVLEAASSPIGPELLREALADQASTEVCADREVRSSKTARPPSMSLDLASRVCDGIADGVRVVERVRSLGLTVVTLEDPTYPARLRLVDLPPPILYVRGSVEAIAADHVVAIVGTRWPTDKGRLIAGWIASAVARTGAVVVSGLAVGIDGAAHAAVVAEGLCTVAVLGGGHAHLFPRAHERLADAIAAAGGAVVSELLPDTSPSRSAFPRRNRIVSGMSDATVVVEAGRRSGALITAGWALEQGRECFLVPGPFDATTSAGCHAFLRSFPGQARLVSGIPELLEDLELDGGAAIRAAEAVAQLPRDKRRSAPGSPTVGAGRAAVLASLAPVERALAEMLVEGPASADDLSRRTSLGAAAILSALTLLELRGLAAGAGGRYVPMGVLAAWSSPRSTRLKRRE
ncbi:MAG TPA: DNA-processing protein DprA [Terriglobales bacterium]|nr:DNA-processing protein DprA [Terriglobales bacterium]